MPAPIVVVDYDPAWPSIARRLIEEVRAACGGLLVQVEHIGSTAVPGLAAKPIIDLMPGLARPEDGLACVAPMEALGYEYRGAFGIPGRHYFPRQAEGERLAVHAHMFVVGHPEWTRHLLFRDYLRAHPRRMREYEALKRGLAERFRDERAAYTDAKSDFVRATDAMAAQWDSAGRPSVPPGAGEG
jgi:GrpB-like predicted nucleotidyltransferase (UPF0157 family)